MIRLQNTVHVPAGKFVLIQFGGLGSRFYFWREGTVAPGETDIRWIGALKNGVFQKLGTNTGSFSGGAPRLKRVPQEVLALEAQIESLEKQLKEISQRKEPEVPRTEIILPPEIYAVPGKEINVYFDNLFLEDNHYSLDVSGILAGVVQQNERLKIIPEKTGSATLTVTAYSRDATYSKLAEAKISEAYTYVMNSTTEDIALFKAHVGPNVKIKAAGGIASFADAEHFIELGADRLGTSRVIKLALQEKVEEGTY